MTNRRGMTILAITGSECFYLEWSDVILICQTLFCTVKLQFLAAVALVEGAAVIDEVAVAEGLLHAPAEGLSLQGAPSTRTLYLCLRQRPRTVGTHDGDVGMVAWAQKTALPDVEVLGWMVGHERHQLLDRNSSRIDQSQHGDEAKLHHRHSRSGPSAASFFLRG